MPEVSTKNETCTEPRHQSTHPPILNLMLDFFKTASGGMNYVLMGGVFAWLASTWIIAAHMHKHSADVITAQNAAKLSDEQKKEQESLRIEADRLRVAAENRLAAAEIEISDLKPKPFPFRLRQLLEKIDSRILPSLSQGTTHFGGNLPPFLFTELQGLAAEDSVHKYITLTVEPMIAFGETGTFNAVKFELSQILLDPPNK